MGMRAVLVSMAVVVLVACGGGSSTKSAGSTKSSSATSSAGSSSSDRSAGSHVDLTKPCTVLSPADFSDAGVTVDSSGEDVSSNFNLTTDTSNACQWTNFAGSVGGSWELVMGSGGAQAAYSNAAPFAGTAGVKKLSLGDESYFVDKVSQLASNDHDFEVGVRKGDVLFTLSTTDDDGSPAIQSLAATVARRLG